MEAGPRSIPPVVVDFLKAFYSSIKLQRVNEVALHYERGWKDLSKRFYPADSWPRVADVSSLVNNDRQFLTLYRLMYYKHQLMSVSSTERPAELKTYIEAWFAYSELVDMVLAEADAAATAAAAATASGPTSVADWQLPAVWVYEMMTEYVYHCEKFQRRRSGAAVVTGSDEPVEEPSTPGQAPAFPPLPSQAGVSTGGPLPAGITEEELASVWRPADVLRNLHTLTDRTFVRESLLAGGPGAAIPSFRSQVGYFSLVALVRLYAKLGDVGAALDCAKPLGVGSSDALVARNGAAHASLALSVAWCLALSRRWDEALRLVSRTLRHFQQTVRVLEDDREERGPRGGAFLRGLADKLLQLCALLVAACPGAPVDDMVRKPLFTRHGDLIGDISGTDMALALGGLAAVDAEAKLSARLLPVFDASTPGWMSWTTTPAASDAAAAVGANARRLFTIEMVARLARLARARASNLRMYTSISATKMAQYANENLVKKAVVAAAAASTEAGATPTPAEAASKPDTSGAAQDATVSLTPEDMRAILTALKVGAWVSSNAVTAATAGDAGSAAPATGLHVATGSGALHVVLSGDTARVDEARAQFNVAAFFVNGIERMHRTRKDDRDRAERAAREASGGGQAGEGGQGYAYGGSGGRQGGGGDRYGSGGGRGGRGGDRSDPDRGDRDREGGGGRDGGFSYAGRGGGSPRGRM